MSETATRTLVHYETREGVAWITLDDPPANTYTHEMMRQLDDAILAARFDAGVHVLVLTGQGERMFCAGANINMLKTSDPTFKYYFCLHANETLSRLEQTPKLVVAALNGHAVGGGLEVALDFAIQASPDHPWVREHPEWFFHRPDGTIKYAENPPKKYQDVYPVNFVGDDPAPLWQEMKRVIDFWIGHGVKTFRVDNPHTKPVPFWEWLIRAVQTTHPEVVFLAEAFTRPKMMRVLAKAGFTQSYTYFTWRNEKQELIDYFTEITTPPVSDYFRGNLWPNTPDILHETLQRGGRPAFKFRVVMAATLSSLYGVYSGYELCENVPFAPGSEEYRDSEKYELKPRDWNAPGNLTDYLTRLNRIRREHPALQRYDNLRFYTADDPNILWYGKIFGDDAVFVAVNLEHFVLDPFYACRRPALHRHFSAHFSVLATAHACAPGLPFLDVDAEAGEASLLALDPARVYEVDYLLAEGNTQAMSRWGHSMLRLVVCAPGRAPGRIAGWTWPIIACCRSAPSSATCRSPAGAD